MPAARHLKGATASGRKVGGRFRPSPAADPPAGAGPMSLHAGGTGDVDRFLRQIEVMTVLDEIREVGDWTLEYHADAKNWHAGAQGIAASLYLEPSYGPMADNKAMGVTVIYDHQGCAPRFSVGLFDSYARDPYVGPDGRPYARMRRLIDKNGVLAVWDDLHDAIHDATTWIAGDPDGSLTAGIAVNEDDPDTLKHCNFDQTKPYRPDHLPGPPGADRGHDQESQR